jgi:hypothetical protein
MLFTAVVFMDSQRVLWANLWVRYSNWLLPPVMQFFPNASKINTVINRSVVSPSCVNEICPIYWVRGAVWLLNCRKAADFKKKIDLHWFRALMIPLHLGLLLRPLLPYNLISVQQGPVPLPKFQMAPRFKTLMSSGSNKLILIYYPFLS